MMNPDKTLGRTAEYCEKIFTQNSISSQNFQGLQITKQVTEKSPNLHQKVFFKNPMF